MRFSALRILLLMVLCGVVCRCASAQEPVAAQPPGSPQAAEMQDSGALVHDKVPIAIVPSADDPVAFTVHVDGRALGWTPATETEPRHTEVELQVTTFDKKNKELNRDAEVIKASAPASVPPTGTLIRNIDIAYKLDINPKAVRARFVVRVTSTGRVGKAETALKPIVVPPLPPAAPTSERGDQ
jgi:hypothetical protein